MEIADAARIIMQGGVVAFPTETVYGLGADATNPQAVHRIFEAKGRPSDNPLIVHVSCKGMASSVAEISSDAELLIDRFWPGPLTLILPKKQSVPEEVTAGLASVGIRMPSHPIALDLIRLSGVPIAAPSANRSGRPSPTTAGHVRSDFPHIPIIDGGPCKHGVESTVVRLGPLPAILRQGAIPIEQIREFLPRIMPSQYSDGKPESPGMKYLHYAPVAPLILFRHDKISSMKAFLKRNESATVLCPSEHAGEFPGHAIVPLGSGPEDIAHNLYSALRTEHKGDILVCLGIPPAGIGAAVMDRLERAARETR